MYWDWASLQEEIQCDRGNQSVLHKFPSSVGREVACHVVKHIAQSLSIASGTEEPSSLQDEKDVKWTMEVLCFGLGLPLTEHETINNCVKVYVEWLTALVSAKPCVPRPIVEDPNPFAQDMLHHLLNLFTPRPDSGPDLVNKQALLCHRVLRVIESVAKESTMITRETWEVLLKFLLAANDSLLSPPTEKDDISDHLCDRVLSVLFMIWLTACHKSFPSPSLWKTFQNMCLFWRHHKALIDMWHRVNHALTANMLKIMYGADYPEMTIGEEEAQLLPTEMGQECIAQSWFRFLHILQNPVDLSRPSIVSNTPKFLQHALTIDAVVDPSYHPCLKKLPQVFLKAMKGISVMVNAFLGLPQETNADPLSDSYGGGGQGGKAVTTPSTPPGQRKSGKTISGVLTSTLSTKGSSKSQSKTVSTPPVSSPYVEKLLLDACLPYAPRRPQCNSILHLFGAWLFDAALTGIKLHPSHAAPAKERRTSSFIESKHTALPMDLNADPDLSRDIAYQTGRAEACGALCRIFCAHKTREVILPEYYSRFYIVLYYGLQTDEFSISGEVLSNILFNSCSLLRIDLSGVQILFPYILKAIERVLSKTTPDFKLCEQIPYTELRKACIHLLLSMLCLPLHFKDLQIKDILGRDTNYVPVTFMSLRTRITELIRVALTNETDSHNTQMLLGGFMLLVEDLATCEQADNLPLQSNQDLSDGDLQMGDTSRTSASSMSTGEANSYQDPVYHRFGHQSNRNLDTAYGLFGLATSLVCNRLMATWKTDLNSALAAMELLSGLAKVKIQPPNIFMCKRTVKWMCDLIVFQCSRPAPSHSRDLHSMLCAAFKCLQLWLVEHSCLLYDRECLHQVLEVVELGISGSKSQASFTSQELQTVKVKLEKDSKSVSMKNRASDPPKFKGNKELMPASMRVKDAAEALLTCIIDQVGAFPPPCGPESLFSLLDERSLLKFAKGNALPEQGSLFRYFVIDNSVIVGLLEQPLGNIEEPLPTVTALIRGAFGRHAWTMQLRHSPRASKISSKAHLSDIDRPHPDNTVGIQHNVTHRYFPESVNKITQTKADKSIPSLESVLTDKQKEDAEKMKSLIDQVATFEKEVSHRAKVEREKTPYPDVNTECKPPKICNEYQTARLFLSHYGLLSLKALKEPSNSSVPPDLVMLDTTNSSLFTDLENLDFIPSRDNDTVHIFYVKPGQTRANDILNNVTSYSNVQPQFVEFLHALGWPVDVRKHAGWTGHVTTSWKITEPDEDMDDEDYQTGTGGSLYDGNQQVLYWADVLSEVAMVVPSPETLKMRTSSSSDPDKSPPTCREGPLTSSPDPSVMGSSGKPNTLLLEAERASNASKTSNTMDGHSWSTHDSSTSNTSGGTSSVKFRRLGRQPASMTGPDTKVLVVWLESFEDHHNFPVADLLVVTGTGQDSSTTTSSSHVQRPPEKDIYVLFIHALENGLFRIQMMEYEKTQTKMSVAIPLVDGMVVSRRTLGSMVRQTAINICRRRRLESESYQPPHVRRKLKIQEMVMKYKCTMSPAEFYTALFHDTPK